MKPNRKIVKGSPIYAVDITARDGNTWTIYCRPSYWKRPFRTDRGTWISAANMIPYRDVPRCFGCDEPIMDCKKGDPIIGYKPPGQLVPGVWHQRCAPTKEEMAAMDEFFRLMGFPRKTISDKGEAS